MDIILIIVTVLLMGAVAFLLIKINSNKILSLSDEEELKFFKQEKNYYRECMVVLSAKHRVIFANQTAKDLLSLNKDNNGKNLNQKVEIKIGTALPEEFFSVLKKMDNTVEKSFKLENGYLIVDGKSRNANIYIDKQMRNSNKTTTCVIDFLEDNFVSVKSENISKDKDGSIDFLTGLPSQFLALSDINALVIDCNSKRKTFSLLLLGIDHFKDFQMALGIDYTNQIIRKLGRSYINNTDENISVYRMDGDKFLFAVENLRSDEEFKDIAKKLMISTSNISRDNNNIRLTTSVGVARYPQDGKNATKLINNVYIALNEAQSNGDSNIELFKTENQMEHSDNIEMNEDIRKAIQRKEFLLYYQPIFDLEGEVVIGVEALVRWNHPTQGLINADKFLSIVEKTGLVVELGEYVFELAIKQYKRFNHTRYKNFQITINLSLKEMNIEELIPKLTRLFDKYSVDRNAINLDISESSTMENIDKISSDLKRLKEFGISISLDNFGASYSSLKYLGLLPLNMIKIDRSLIFGLTLNYNQQTAVKAIINLAHTFDFKVVAEGVETSEEASILSILKCDYAQGYLYSKPLPAKDIEELLL